MKTKSPSIVWGGLALVVRVLLGGLFVFAAIVKLRNPQLFVQGVMAFKILPDHLATLTAFVVPWLEVLAGVALILGWWARAGAVVLGGMLLAFIGGMLSVLARDLDVHCSCFGKFEIPCSGAIGPCHLARNAVLFAMAMYVAVVGPGSLAVDRESMK
ncbi:MAG: MauE/DoxX family redox-associated membrane protein [Planctomycetota bacterium]|nr:MauE/DoxX family redox-associated membrane protein [Planctomycetota bacterium]